MIVFTISISCSSKKSELVNDQYILKLYQADVSKDIYEIILKSRINFYENNKVYPPVMILNFSQRSNNENELLISSGFSLYYNEQMRTDGGLPSKLAGFKLHRTIVIIYMEDSKFPYIKIPKDKVFISEITEEIKSKYNNIVDMCDDKWDITNNKLLDRKCR